MDNLVPNGENEILFGNIVRSDGFCVDFVFYRRATTENEDSALIENHDLGVDDFSIEEVTQLYRPSFLDPGRKCVYTATTGLNTTENEIRRCSIKEYYHFTGSATYSKRLEQIKDEAGIKAIESVTPTAKTARSITFCGFLNHMLINMDRLFASYNFKTAKDRFNLDQGRQRAKGDDGEPAFTWGTKYKQEETVPKEEKQKKTTK